MKEMERHIELHIKEETYQELMKIVDYYNLKNYIHKTNEQPLSIETFIKGCITQELERINSMQQLVDPEFSKGRIKNRIKENAESEGLKLKDLHELTKIDKGNLSKIFNNKNQPSIDYLLRIYFALGCPPLEELFYRE